MVSSQRKLNGYKHQPKQNRTSELTSSYQVPALRAGRLMDSGIFDLRFGTVLDFIQVLPLEILRYQSDGADYDNGWQECTMVH